MKSSRFLLLLIIFILGQLLVTFLFSYSSSPIFASDSEFYMDGVRRFPYLLDKHKPYLTMILYLKLFFASSLSGWTVLFANSIIVLLAGQAIWHVTYKISNANAAWLSSCIWFLNPLTAQWTRFISTEPRCYSSIIFWLWFSLYRPNWIFIFFTTFISALRPNSFTLLASALSWIGLIKGDFRIRTFINTAIVWLLTFFVFWLVFLRSSPDSLKLLDVANNGIIMWNPLGFNLNIAMDYGIYSYIKLFFSRITWELIQIRPWYSLNLNLFILVFMSLFYFFALRGAWLIKSTMTFWSIIVVSLPSIILIGITWSIYEGRFGWWFLVAWIPLVAIGIDDIFSKVLKLSYSRYSL